MSAVPKLAPIRVVKVTKFNLGNADVVLAPSERNHSDDLIQSTNSRRRYMRRGSKAPSMFLLAELRVDCINEPPPKGPAMHRRKLSLMSMLSEKLRETDVFDDTKRTVPRPILKRQRSSPSSE